MGIVDKAKEMLAGNTEQAKEGVDKAARQADEKTGGKYSDKIEKGAEQARSRIDKTEEGRRDQPGG